MPAEVGVLALQGDFANHMASLSRIGLPAREVRRVGDLYGIGGLVIPGGESTTIQKGLEREGLIGPLHELHRQGLPVLGTCAGLVLLGRGHLGWLDVEVERNAYGPQIASFEADVSVSGLGHPPVRAAFIRAPIVRHVGEGVEVLARVGEDPVAVRQGAVVGISFHPELTGDDRLHELALSGMPAAAVHSA